MNPFKYQHTVNFNAIPDLKKDKGKFNGSCNRTACQQPGATWYNKGTQKFYCHHCAVLINQHCSPNDLLCTEDVRVHAVGFVKSK